MRSLFIAMAAAISLTGCSNEAADAERELAILENANGSSDEICAAARRVADVHLKAHNQQKYAEAKNRGNIRCQSAQLDEAAAGVPDDMAPAN